MVVMKKTWLRPLGLLGLLGLAAYLLLAAVQSKGDEPEPVRRAGLVQVFPQSGTVGLRQDAVGVELQFGYSGRLRLDRTDIPDDQLDVIPGINRISFTPGEGKEISSLAEGRHCATVIFWSSPDGEAAADRHTWCFTAA